MTTSTRPTRLEVNCTTGEETVIELSDEEIAELEQRQQENANLEAERIAAEQARAEAKASAEAKLSALGLTPEEIAALR